MARRVSQRQLRCDGGWHHVRWIGGSPCSGKSTVLAALAQRGMTTYSCDDHFDDHAREAVAAGHATFQKVLSMTACDRLAQPIQVQVHDVFALAGEQWPYIEADLCDLLDAGTAVVEGSALLPRNLEVLGVDPAHAVWLVPTEEFQRDRYGARLWARELVAACPEPEAAFDRWMRRDAAFSKMIASEAERHGIKVVEVETSRPPEELLSLVAVNLGID